LLYLSHDNVVDAKNANTNNHEYEEDVVEENKDIRELYG